MKRIVASLLGLVAMAALIAAPAWLWDTEDSASGADEEATSISRMVADFRINKDGDLSAVETIDVDVTTDDRHGIFRYFDRHDPNAPRARRTPHDVTVTMNGQPVPWTSSHEDGARYTVLKIGDPDRTLDQGTHRYEIRYTIPGVLLKSKDQTTTFYWNVIPGGWQQEMSDVTVRVALPVPAGETVRCGIGWGDEPRPCTATGAGTTEVSLHLDSLTARTPVTLMTTLEMATPPEGGTLPWSMRWDRVIGTHLWLAILVGLIGLVGAVLGAWLGAKAREKRPAFPLVYAPPTGINPAQGAYILRETIPRQAFVATLLDGAQRGTVSLERDESSWTVRVGKTAAVGSDLAYETASRLAGGGQFIATKRDVKAGERLQREIATFKKEVRSWALKQGYLSKTGFSGKGSVAVFGGLGLAVVNLLWNPFGMTLLSVIPGAFAILGFSMAAAGAGTMRTRAGRELWSQVGGFRRVLSTPSSKERFDFSGRQELYTAYIPWAVALGCAEQWAKKYRVETGSEPPLPSYVEGAYVATLFQGDRAASSLASDFDSTVNSAIASYSATQASSSDGGGFSGGGGGGGGGGGSW